jgi:hypothetical protein
VRVRRGLPGALRRPLPPLSALLHVGREGGTKPTCGPATTRRSAETGHATAVGVTLRPFPGCMRSLGCPRAARLGPPKLA